MNADEAILDDFAFLRFQTKLDNFFKANFQFAERLGLSVATFQVGDNADIPAILILLNDDWKPIALHGNSLAGPGAFGKGDVASQARPRLTP